MNSDKVQLNGDYVKWTTFTFIAGIFIVVVSAAFGLLWTAVDGFRADITQIKIDGAVTREKVEGLAKEVENAKSSSTSMSDNPLINLLTKNNGN